MRVGSAVALAVVVLALGVAGFATASRMGVLQAGAGPRSGTSALDPEQVRSGLASPVALPSGLCPPLPEASGVKGSDLTAGGPCPFHQAGPASCRSAADDFYAVVHRLLPGGRTLDLYVNVEFYHGPGPYSSAQLLLIVQDGPTLYQWSNFQARAEVGPAERWVSLSRVEMATEPGLAGAGLEMLSGQIGC